MQKRLVLSVLLGVALLAPALLAPFSAHATGPKVAMPVMRQLVRVNKSAKLTIACTANWCSSGYTILVRSWNGGCERARFNARSWSFSFDVAYSQSDWAWAPMIVEVYYPPLDQNRVAQPPDYAAVTSAYLSLSMDRSAKVCPSAPAGITMSSSPTCVARPGGNPWPDPDLAGCPKN